MLLLIDGNGLLHRCFHAFKKPLSFKRNGVEVPCHAVYASLRVMDKLTKTLRPRYLAIAFDMSRKTFRNDLYGEYKANRALAPLALVPQFGLFREALDAFRITYLESSGYEADDILHTLAVKAESCGIDCVIYSGDRDLVQTLSSLVTLLYPKKNSGAVAVTPSNAEEVIGFSPEWAVDFKALVGDDSDNIPGVPGVGPKTAALLLKTYGSVERIYASDEAMNKYGKKLAPYWDQVIANRLLIQLVTVPLETTIEQLVYAPDLVRGQETLREYKFNLPQLFLGAAA